MRKIRGNSTWSRLTREQRERLESWLFDENMGYAKAAARVRMEFGVETSIAGMGRYYRQRARERREQKSVAARLMADRLNNLAMDTDSLWAVALKLVGRAAASGTLNEPDKSGKPE